MTCAVVGRRAIWVAPWLGGIRACRFADLMEMHAMAPQEPGLCDPAVV